MTATTLGEAAERLRKIVRQMGSVLIAYSGGVDSALVAAVCREQLPGRSCAVLGRSPSVAESEIDSAVRSAQRIGIELRIVQTAELEDPRYRQNDGSRCFFCRTHLFAALSELKSSENWQTIADGVHEGDLTDHAGGIAAARRYGVRSPLLEARFDKSLVRAMAREFGLSAWNKPASPCLASRIPIGTPVSRELLLRIDQAEAVLRALGFENFRVRHHGDLARIELPADEFAKVLELREQVVRGIKQVGYRFATLDLVERKGVELSVVQGT